MIRFYNIDEARDVPASVLKDVHNRYLKLLPLLVLFFFIHSVLLNSVRAERLQEESLTAEQAEQGSLDDVAYLKVNIGTGEEEQAPEKIYVGQRTPFEVTAFFGEQIEARPNYPDIKFNLEEVVLAESGDINPQNRYFQPLEQDKRVIDDMVFDVYRFHTEFTPLQTGLLHGWVTLRTSLRTDVAYNLEQPSSSNGFDQNLVGSFFGPREQREEVELKAPVPIVEIIKPPPASPEAGFALGLVGDWTLRIDSQPREVAAGEPFTVELTVAGDGDPRSLEAPRLEPYLEDFRGFPPEVKLSRKPGISEVVLTWVLIPLQAEARLPDLTFSTFNPETAKYESATFSIPLTVTARIQEEERPIPGVEDDIAEPPIETAVPGEAIRGVKADLRKPVRLPLWRNALFPAGLLLVSGFCLGGYLALTAIKRERRQAGGATAQEDESISWLQGLFRLTNARSNKAQLVVEAVILSAVSAGIVIVVMLLTLLRPVEYGEEFRNSFDRAVALYQLGDYDEAAHLFRSLAPRGDKAASLEIAYNLGNCAYLRGDPALALVRYKQAMRLAPRDSDVLANRHAVRGELGLAASGETVISRSTATRIRDLLRPDEWIVGGAIFVAFSLIFGGWAYLRRLEWIVFLGIGAAFVVLTWYIVNLQYETTYHRKGEGIVASRQARVYRLPDAEFFEPFPANIVIGETVAIEESRTGWHRIRLADDRHGWITDDDLLVIWP